MSAAVIFGCAGTVLSPAERRFFQAVDPLGFILFARNCAEPQQVRELTEALRDAVVRPDAPILIDQEGGRVTRLKPPHWRAAPAASRFGALAAERPAIAEEAARLNARLIAADLAALGISVDCAPVLDLSFPGANAVVVGDRALHADPQTVTRLGRAVCDGLLAGGVLPVIKHLPGHGRATADSHYDLPVVDVPLATLEQTDFVPFRELSDIGWGITAHVVYTAIDPARPATLSPTVVEKVIRERIGFDGLLLCDDISMKALRGELPDLARDVLAAGCDLVLHCNGKMEEMEAIAGVVGPMSVAAEERVARAWRQLDAIAPTAAPLRERPAEAEERLAALLQV